MVKHIILQAFAFGSYTSPKHITSSPLYTMRTEHYHQRKPSPDKEEAFWASGGGVSYLRYRRELLRQDDQVQSGGTISRSWTQIAAVLDSGSLLDLTPYTDATIAEHHQKSEW
ncbi:hypothetical protein Ancab_030084 [Ancistrocladus abbreviatus]